MKQNQIIDNLNKILEEFINKEPIPGLAVGVVMNKEIIFTKGFGVKNTNTNDPVTKNSLFHMASVSKTFVAMAIMQLVEDDKLNLDSYVTEYLPYFEMNDDRYKKVTIRQLLSHLSGMPDENDFEWEILNMMKGR